MRRVKAVLGGLAKVVVILLLAFVFLCACALTLTGDLLRHVKQS